MANSMLVASVRHVLRENSVSLELLRVPIVQPIKSPLPVPVHAQPVLTGKEPHQSESYPLELIYCQLTFVV